jgi:hypothetical protein
MNNEVLDKEFTPQREGAVRCKQQLGGIIKSYYREAAYHRSSRLDPVYKDTSAHEIGLPVLFRLARQLKSESGFWSNDTIIVIGCRSLHFRTRQGGTNDRSFSSCESDPSVRPYGNDAGPLAQRQGFRCRQ